MMRILLSNPWLTFHYKARRQFHVPAKVREVLRNSTIMQHNLIILIYKI
jgi:hypothetical protein